MTAATFPLSPAEFKAGFRWLCMGHPPETAESAAESAGYQFAYALWCRGADPRAVGPDAGYDLWREENAPACPHPDATAQHRCADCGEWIP